MKAAAEYGCLSDWPEIDLPPRTSVFRLKPFGLGTGARESLSSYIERLAEAHTFASHWIYRLPTVRSYFGNRSSEGKLTAEGCFNGGGAVSAPWIKAVEDLTRQSGLQALTLAPIAPIINPRNLMSTKRRWCPECLGELMLAGGPYFQLLWDVLCVSACPTHKLKLGAECGCRSARNEKTRDRKPFGYCNQCDRPLSEAVKREAAPSSAVNVARVVNEFLGNFRFENGGWSRAADRSGEFLLSVAAVHFDGSASNLADALGVSKSSLHGWVHGKTRPPLDWFVGLAMHFKCSIVDVLDGRGAMTGACPAVIPRVRCRRRPTTTERLTRIAAALDEAVASSVASTLRQIADDTQVTPAFLRKHFPTQCAEIVQKARADRVENKRIRKAEGLAALRLKAEQLAKSGIVPTSRRVLHGVKLPAARYAQFRAELDQILSEVRTRMTAPR